MIPVQSEQNTFTLTSQPGVRRDGTAFANRNYQDSKWVRFQRGLPRKMGGYVLMSDLLSGPIRAVFLDSRGVENSAHCFSQSGIEKLTFDSNGVGGGVLVRTPTGFVNNENYTWQADSMYQTGGAGSPVLVAAATPDLANIAEDTEGPLYSADITGSSLFTSIEDASGPITVSGGLCMLQPFLFVYGSNGLIRNSNANDFSALTGWVIGGASLSIEANVAGSKIVKGLPVRGGGNSPAGMFWSLDTLIRVSFVGGTTIWRYDTVSAATSVLSKSGIVEYDGVYYWPGLDRFYSYNGVVQELPNDMNLNFFYDRMNFAQRQKVWALKVPRFGEIWWFFPSDESSECDRAVIFNVREGTWYDAQLVRSAGAPAQVYPKPLMAGGEERPTKNLTFTPTSGAFNIGETVTGGTSGAVGVVLRVQTTEINVSVASGNFVLGEVISSTNGVGTISVTPFDQPLDALWQHETGVNRIYKQDVTAIPAEFTTTEFSWMTGGPVSEAPAGNNLQTRLVRVEPDFVLAGNLDMYVQGKAFAQGEDVVSDPYLIEPTTEYVDLREQRREMSVRFVSNELDGDFQMGRTVMTVEPGDARG